MEQHKQAITELASNQTIGSKYRFQKSSVSVADLQAEIRQKALIEKEKAAFDMELYLDIKPDARGGNSSKRAVEQLADDEEKDRRRLQISRMV